MRKIKWPNGRDTAKLRAFAKAHRDLIMGGTILAIDPASKSAGYAIFNCGILQESGALEVEGPISQRLNDLFYAIVDLGVEPDIMTVETIRKTGHLYLRWSCGTVVAAADATHTVEIPTNQWRTLAPPDYVKSDAGDAELMGLVLIEYAREIDL